MARRRMFSLDVIDTDEFMEMPASSQCLYFHLAMRADDDGFVASPRRITKSLGSAEDDLRVLVAKRFVLPFSTGVCVIRHWRVHNLLRGDRYTETLCKAEKASLLLGENNEYLPPDSGNQLATGWQPTGNQLATTNNSDCGTQELQVVDGKGDTALATRRQPNGNQMAPQDRLGKDRLGKDRDILSGTDSPFLTVAKEVIEKLNAEACRHFKPTPATVRPIIARLNEGFMKSDLFTVIDNQVRRWGMDAKMSQYLRPETLFGTKMQGYLQPDAGAPKIRRVTTSRPATLADVGELL